MILPKDSQNAYHCCETFWEFWGSRHGEKRRGGLPSTQIFLDLGLNKNAFRCVCHSEWWLTNSAHWSSAFSVRATAYGHDFCWGTNGMGSEHGHRDPTEPPFVSRTVRHARRLCGPNLLFAEFAHACVTPVRNTTLTMILNILTSILPQLCIFIDTSPAYNIKRLFLDDEMVRIGVDMILCSRKC